MVTITISGTPGSGKSTVAVLLEKKLEIKRIYSGMIFRETADKYKMSLEEFGRFCEKNNDIDKELDDRQLEILKKGDVILEGRLAGWLAYLNKIPAFKIIIDTDIETRANRIVNREAGNVEKRKKEIIKREKSEILRYKKYYNIDLKDTSIYDLVIDSGDKTPEEIVGIILEKLER
jgi:predicted cytidylate kinase